MHVEHAEDLSLVYASRTGRYIQLVSAPKCSPPWLGFHRLDLDTGSIVNMHVPMDLAKAGMVPHAIYYVDGGYRLLYNRNGCPEVGAHGPLTIMA